MGALKGILEEVAIQSLSTGIKKTSRLVRIKSTKKYIEALQIVRTAWLSILSTQLFLILSALSFLGSITAFLFLLPIDAQTRLWIMFAVSFSVFIISCVSFAYLNSEKKWLEFSKANELIAKVIWRNEL